VEDERRRADLERVAGLHVHLGVAADRLAVEEHAVLRAEVAHADARLLDDDGGVLAGDRGVVVEDRDPLAAADHEERSVEPELGATLG
jgi:hypothetical protein